MGLSSFMVVKYNRLVIIFCVLCLSCTSTKINTKTTDILQATALKPFGRYIINKEQNVELISSAVHVGFSFEGNECRIFASIPCLAGHNYLQYELDGEYQKRIKISGNSRLPVVLTAQK
ncbi:MAG TPA: hypothetical protein VKA92_04780, partial [Segetibacter sp.]|nr:hypothetical protein [Segetibacter sp.]